MFGDNFLVVKLTVMPASKLQCPYHIIKYHSTRESQVKVIIKFVRINGNDNPADYVTKTCTSNTWFPLMNPLLFWIDMELIHEQVFHRGE